MAYSLPMLPYAYDALEPYIDEQTLRLHHLAHHKAYVEKFNAALSRAPQLQNVPIEEILSAPENVPVDVRSALVNNGGGHYNHSLFWSLLTPEKNEPHGYTLEAIRSQFGSFENFQEKFTDTTVSHFGSGYGWLCMDDQNRLHVISLPNQDTPMLKGMEPLLLVDVWEHAYYLKYQNRRAEFVKAIWNIIDWRAVEKLYIQALTNKRKRLSPGTGVELGKDSGTAPTN